MFSSIHSQKKRLNGADYFSCFPVYRLNLLNIGTSIVAMVHQPLKPLLHPTLEAYHGLTPSVSSTPPGTRDVKAKILASALVSASKLWPRPRPWLQTFGLGLASVCRTSSQEEIDGLLYFGLPTTGHHTMIEDSYCARENEK